MNDINSAVLISSLVKRFDGVPALNSVDLNVPSGTFFGLVGPNGAGKTTLISVLTGLMDLDGGSLSIFGYDIQRHSHQAKAVTGVLMASSELFQRLTGEQLVVHAGMLRGLSRAEAKARADDLIQLFGLDGAAERLVVDYSTGMQKKISLATALVHTPRLLVLDEPFESIDPVSAITMRTVLESFVADGGTVLMTSHSMDLVERTCTGVAILVDSQILAAGSMEDIRSGVRLEDRFLELLGGREIPEGPAWLRQS